LSITASLICRVMAEPEIITLGCRLNAYESEVMRGHAQRAGLEDVVIINTCAVTAEAERQARQTIRKIYRDRPDAQIVVTGCAAQIDPDRFAAMPEVARVIGNDRKLDAATWQFDIAAQGKKIHVTDIMAVTETAHHLIEGFDGRTRAFIQVQNGCDHRCTFCIIPFGRGNSRSVPIGVIVDQVRMLVGRGFHEIVMTGVDVTSYGSDLPGQPKLGQMIRRVLALVPELPRLRLSSVDPVEIDEDLWLLLENEPRLMPYLHLSVQAGDDMILKRMKRRHLRHDILKLFERARRLRPDISFGADIIAGFPTETDAMFENSLRLVEEADLSFLHVFPYSARSGTPAAKMPQVPGAVRKERAARLRAEGEKILHRFYQQQIGKDVTLLMERGDRGRAENFVEVMTGKGDYQAGQLYQTRIIGFENGQLIAA